MPRTFRNILYHPALAIALFVLLAGAARFSSVPWWDGPVLEVRPNLPDPSGEIVDPPKYQAEVKEKLAQVDLDRASSESTNSDESNAAGARTDPNGPSDADGNVPSCAVGNEDSPDADRGRRDSCRMKLTPNPEDVELLQVIRELDESLEEPPTDLERPCLEWSPLSLALDHRPVCERRAMDRFFDRLRRVAIKQSERPVRISQYGDSLIAGDAFTGELRRLMGGQFGDGGFGYIHVGKASPHIGTRGLTTDTSSGWKMYNVIGEPNAGVPFGFGGVAFRPYGVPSIGIYPQDEGPGRTYDRVGLLYYRLESESTVEMTIDGDARTVDLSGPADRNAVTWLEVQSGSNNLRFSGFDRSVYMYAVLLENSGPGVVVDNLGLSSGRAPRLRHIDDRQWRAQIDKRNPDLMSFAYGVNSAGKYSPKDEWLAEYRRQYTEVLRDARNTDAGVSCLVIGLLTRGKLQNGRIKIYDSVKPLLRSQREAAVGADCGFWSAFEAIGGAEGTERWYRSHPQLLISDLAHPTRAGYKKLANLFYASLIDEFRRYLEERIRRASVPDLDNDASGDNPPPLRRRTGPADGGN